MKKLAVVGIAIASLALAGCGSSPGYSNNYDYGGYSSNGGWTDHDWDMNYGSVYNNNTYCSGGTYKPLPNNQYSCIRNGVTSAPSKRPPVVVPPKSAQKPPADVLKKVEQQKAQQQQQQQQKQTQPKQNNAPKQNSVPKPAAPRPAPKSGK